VKLTIEQATQLQLALRARLHDNPLIKKEINAVNSLLDLLKHGQIIIVDSHDNKAKEFVNKLLEEDTKECEELTQTIRVLEDKVVIERANYKTVINFVKKLKFQIENTTNSRVQLSMIKQLLRRQLNDDEFTIFKNRS